MNLESDPDSVVFSGCKKWRIERFCNKEGTEFLIRGKYCYPRTSKRS